MASRGRRGEDTPSSVALTGRLDKVLQRLEEGEWASYDQDGALGNLKESEY